MRYSSVFALATVFLAVAAVCAADIAHADGYIPLVADTFPEVAHGSGSFAKFLDTVYRYGIVIAGILGVIMLIIAAIQHMTTDAFTKKSELKKRMGEILGGLLLAVCSYLILYTINPQLVQINFGALGEGGSLGTSRNISVGTSGSVSTGGGTVVGGSATASGDSSQQSNYGTSGALSESVVTDLFNQNGIRKKANAGVGFDGLMQSTVDGTIALKNASGANSMVLSGAREGGHASGTYSHGNGYKVDIGVGSNNSQDWAKIDSTIKSWIGNQNPAVNKKYYAQQGGLNYEFIWEVDHWDMAVIPSK
jgi:hypothetical protein